MEANQTITALVSGGLLGTVGYAAQYWLFGGRNRTKVDSAKAVQGMALEMLQPLHEELVRAREEMAEVRADAQAAREDCSKVRREFEILLGWALTLRDLLQEAGIKHPPVPPRIKERVE
jgi:outer membrane protein TolC